MHRHVLLTGATGVIGSAVLTRLLADPETRVTVLLRATSTAHLQQRVASLRVPPAARPRLVALRGDASQDGLGLPASERQALTATVDAIIHAAGDVRLNHPLAEALAQTLGATQAMVDLLREARDRGRTIALHAVSTIGVAGCHAGVVEETATLPPAGWRNTYETAKAAAEQCLWRAHLQEGLSISVSRPSMVVGAATTGEVARFQVFYHLLDWLTGRASGGIVPRLPGLTLDCVPVDWVADAIVAASARPDANGRVLHLCAGPQAFAMDTLVETLRACASDEGFSLPPLRRTSLRAARWLLQRHRRVAHGALARRLDSLPYFLAYTEQPQHFACARTHTYLEAGGIIFPPSARWLPVVLRAYWQAAVAAPMGATA